MRFFTAKKTERDNFGEEIDVIVPVRCVYAVFNANQIDGLPEKYVPKGPDGNPTACEAWFDALPRGTRLCRVSDHAARNVDLMLPRSAQWSAIGIET